VDQTDEPNLSKKKKIWEAGGTSRPCRIAGQEIARLKVGPDGSDAKKKISGKEAARADRAALLASKMRMDGLDRSGPVRSRTGSVLGPPLP